jgi:hypothetical protein
MLYLANDYKDYKQVCAKFRAQVDINTRWHQVNDLKYQFITSLIFNELKLMNQLMNSIWYHFS